ncbi:MAG TPA: hypothetical protein VGO21_04455 [Candidatus Paceibacterota bacterium]|jgi:hypothetical protein|nr:hypothetical protein [Candidatus Paceibacterota bacterium]
MKWKELAESIANQQQEEHKEAMKLAESRYGEWQKEEEKRKKDSQNKLVGRFIMAKIYDIASILILIASVSVVIYLFRQSLFEGFVSLVADFFFLRYIFKKRSEDFFFSWFSGWF